MRLDDLPDQFAAFADRARDVLNREIERAHQAVKAANAEKAKTQSAISELQDQREAAKKQLNDVLADLHRGSSLVGLNHDIAEARKTLDTIKGEMAKVSTALEAAVTQRKEAEGQLQAVLGRDPKASCRAF
jgi:chromosome segregation ATPase